MQQVSAIGSLGKVEGPYVPGGGVIEKSIRILDMRTAIVASKSEAINMIGKLQWHN